MLIVARALSKSYDARVASGAVLKGVSLAIAEGEFVAIVGPSGSGKSTLMNVLGLLESPSTGSLTFNGRDVAKANAAELAAMRNRDIGFVFQSYHLLPRLSAAENVELPLLYSGCGRRIRKLRAVAALDAVGLADRRTRRPSALSGGEQQRVAIARAIVANPRLVLADEPTGALDSATGDKIMALFEDLNKAGRAIVMVTHDRDIAQRAARRVHMRDGVLIDDERDGQADLGRFRLQRAAGAAR